MLWLYRDSAVSGWCKWIRLACTTPASFSSCQSGIFDWRTCAALHPSQLLPLPPHGCCHCHHLQCPSGHFPLTRVASSSQHFFPSPQLPSPMGWALPPQTSSSQNNCISDHARSKNSSSLVLHLNRSTSIMHVLVQAQPPQTCCFRQNLHIPIFQFLHVGGFRPHVRSHVSLF